MVYVEWMINLGREGDTRILHKLAIRCNIQL